MKRAIVSIIFTLMTLVTGCAAQSPWAQRPVADDGRLVRARAVAAPLFERCRTLPLRIDVLASDVPGAYSWPDGRIAVTAALVDALDDAELAAAVAHELGHLLNDGHVRGVAALKGCGAHQDQEEDADETGVRLLVDCHLPPRAMARMLSKVKDSPRTPDGCRAALASRALRLERAVAAAPHP